MVIWMVYDAAGLKRNAGYVSLFQRHCQPYGAEVEVVLDVEVRRKSLAGERPVCAFVRTIGPEINRFLEEQGIPVFNSSEVSYLCNHKGRTLAYLRNRVFCVPSITVTRGELSHILDMDVPEVRGYFQSHFPYSAFEERERSIVGRAEDFVVKTADGHGGSEVYSLCMDRDSGIAALLRETGTDASELVLQPMVTCGTVYRDMRVYVIGTGIAAAVMRSSVHDFRANYSRGGDVRRVDLTPEQIEEVNRITACFTFGMAGIDFLFDTDGQIVLNEIEDVAGARMLYACAPELDIVHEYVKYVLEERLGLSVI